MYGGVAAETPASDAAVAATRGQIVTYDGAPVVTYFFSSSGGHTENVENVWPGSTPEPWLRGVVDRYDGAGGDPYHRWSYELSMNAAAAKLGSWVKGKLVGIKVTKHGVSPRIITARGRGHQGDDHRDRQSSSSTRSGCSRRGPRSPRSRPAPGRAVAGAAGMPRGRDRP